MNGIFITGTDTNVGKTWVGQFLISALCKKGVKVVPRKPVESGWDNNKVESTDAWLLAQATNQLGRLDSICPNRFSLPISPARAATLEGKSLSIEELKKQCLTGVSPSDFLYVEGAGGFYSPLCDDGLNADLASALGLPVILVAEDRLGCINQVLLNVEAIKLRGLSLKVIVLNTVSSVSAGDMNNAEDLKSLVDYPIICLSFNQDSSTIFNDLALLISDTSDFSV